MARKSKFFRVACEGATTDGREITRATIAGIARTYNRARYGARIFLEHLRGILPDGPFRAYGDVLAVKAEEVDIDGDTKLALFAQIEPTPDLVKLVQAKQKIYTSIEIDPKFAGTNDPYLVGLGITDSPASLGTEVLAFAAQHPESSPFTARKQSPHNLFTAADLVEIELEDEPLDAGPSLFARVKDLLSRKSTSDDTRFADIAQAVEAIATNSTDLADRVQADLARIGEQYSALQGEMAAIQTRVKSLSETIDHTSDPTQISRPVATGSNGAVATDC